MRYAGLVAFGLLCGCSAVQVVTFPDDGGAASRGLEDAAKGIAEVDAGAPSGASAGATTDASTPANDADAGRVVDAGRRRLVSYDGGIYGDTERGEYCARTATFEDGVMKHRCIPTHRVDDSEMVSGTDGRYYADVSCTGAKRIFRSAGQLALSPSLYYLPDVLSDVPSIRALAPGVVVEVRRVTLPSPATTIAARGDGDAGVDTCMAGPSGRAYMYSLDAPTLLYAFAEMP